MRFMCAKHRQQLEENPKFARNAWSRLMYLARHKQSMQEFNDARVIYGNALEAASILFADDPTSPGVNRYVRTATEYAYAARCCGNTCDLEELVDVINLTLAQHLYPADTRLLLKPVQDVVRAPIHEVERWMTALFMADQAEQTQHQTMH